MKQLIFILLFSANAAIAQLFIGINPAFSIPTGVYAEKTLLEDEGLADLGFTGSLALTYKPIQYFGISLAYSFGINPFDEQPFVVDGNQAGYFTTASFDPYIYNGPLFNIYGSLCDSVMGIDIGPTIGGYFITFPDASISYSLNGQTESIFARSDGVFMPVYGGNVAFWVKISQSIKISAFACYLVGEADYTDIASTFSSSYEYSQPFSTVSAGIGIDFIIGKK